MDVLFRENDLNEQLCQNQARTVSKVDAIPEDRFLGFSDREIADQILPQLRVEPIALQLDTKTTKVTETKVDGSRGALVRRQPDGGHVMSPPRQGLVPGACMETNIPYTGEDWIFRYCTDPYWSQRPRGEVRQEHLRISISLPHDAAEPEKFKELYDREIDLIGKYVDSAHKQIAAYNDGLDAVIRQAIAGRRDRLAKYAGLAEVLDIPVAAKDDAP